MLRYFGIEYFVHTHCPKGSLKGQMRLRAHLLGFFNFRKAFFKLKNMIIMQVKNKNCSVLSLETKRNSFREKKRYKQKVS